MSGLVVANYHVSSTVDFASLNCEALSDMISFGLPRRVINLLKHRRNCSADMSLMSSKCTALTAKQLKNSKLLSLNPILDEDGLLRSDGRLRYADYLPSDARYPIILPRKSGVTRLIVN